MGIPQLEEEEDVFQAILLADNFEVSIFGSKWAEKQNPGANKFDDDDEDEESKSSLGQEDVEHALDNAYFRPLLMKVLHYYYYEIGMLSQQMILEWHKTPSAYKGATELRKTVEKFIEWLETASEEESDEDDDSEEVDDD